MRKPMQFDLNVGHQKPYSKKHDACPFCQPEHLTGILEKRGDMIWLMNKYPVFHKTCPTVLIETSRHNGDLSEYAPQKLHEVISFGLEKWRQTEKDKRFRSVLFFRNYGSRAGGSLRHPHSQIIGLYDTDYRDGIRTENFWGPVIHEDDGCIVTISNFPICGMAEFNVTLKDTGSSDLFADAVQQVVRYVLAEFPIPCDSYNLFFYHMKHTYVKIFPRYIASPLYLGYRITLAVDDKSKESIIRTLQEKYFAKAAEE